MWATDRDSVSAWADEEDIPAVERGAWRSQIWIAVVLGLLLPGLPLASLTLFDWNQRPVIASAPIFPSGAIDPSPPAPLPESAAAPEDPALPTLSGRTIAARSAQTARTPDVTSASGPQWLTGFVNDVRQSLSSSWADRRSQPSVMPEPGGHR
jgi:uncharacterized iron-regulated membrane protein